MKDLNTGKIISEKIEEINTYSWNGYTKKYNAIVKTESDSHAIFISDDQIEKEIKDGAEIYRWFM